MNQLEAIETRRPWTITPEDERQGGPNLADFAAFRRWWNRLAYESVGFDFDELAFSEQADLYCAFCAEFDKPIAGQGELGI